MLRIRTLSTPVVAYLAEYVSAGLTLGIICSAVGLVMFSAMTLFNPVLDAYGFRQAQTAINVYSILHDNVVLDYLTPVLGSPWALPFEAPVYQLIVAGVSQATGLALDASGRIVSVLFYFLALASGYRIIKTLLPHDRHAAKLFLLLALVSPLYLFWARSFMVETCALGLGMTWLACVIQQPDRQSIPWLIASVPLCILAALAKATTWPAFVVAYFFYVTADVLRTGKIRIVPVLIGSLGVAAALITTVLWNNHADQLKQLNPFAIGLTAAALNKWNFGTWSQFFSAQFWFDILPRRILPDALGYCWPALLVCVRYARGDSSLTKLSLISIALFFVPIVIFTNLHIVHQYYQSANAIFAIAAAAFLLSDLIAVGRRGVALLVGILLVGGALAQFSNRGWPVATRDLSHDPLYIAANQVRQQTGRDTALIVLGIDWSSEVHYYAERKGVALPAWSTIEQAKALINNPDAAMGNLRPTALVDCRAVRSRYRAELEALLDDFITSWQAQSQNVLISDSPGSCSVYIKRV